MATPNLGIRTVTAGLGSLELLHNQAMNDLDARLHISVIDRDLTAPPGGESEGDRYWVASGATGDWSGQDNKLAYYFNGEYVFYSPAAGWIVWVEDEAIALYWDGSSFNQIGSSATGTGGVILRDPTEFTYSNDAAFTTVLSHTVPANTILSDEGFRIWMFGKCRHNPGTNGQMSLRLRYGGSTFFEDDDFYLDDSNDMAVVIDAQILGAGVIDNVILSGRCFVSEAEAPTGAPSNAVGRWQNANADSVWYRKQFKSSASAQTFEVQWQFANAGPTVSFTRYFYYVQQLF